MRHAGYVAAVLTAVLTAVAMAAVAAAGQSVLSPQQQTLIDHKTASLSQTEKDMIAGWSDARKLAEFFCSRAGLEAMKKQHPEADRMALGPDDEGVKKFVLTGNTKLSGRGTVRMGAPWKGFSFECTLDAQKAIATSFTYTLDK